MKSSVRLATLSTAAALSAALFLTIPGFSQSDAEKAKARADQKAKAIAQARLNNTNILKLYDRQGKEVAAINEREFYNQPTISPDNTRVAVLQNHPEDETVDVWVRDVTTGKATQITSNKAREAARAPVWSPDGKYLAYVNLRNGTEGLYRKPSDGQGTEEELYKHTGFGLNLMGWSVDGKYLSFFTTDLSGGILFVLPLEAQGGQRKPIEAFKSPSQVQGARMSPDNRFISYMSNESGRPEMYVRPLDVSGKNAAPAGGPWKISTDGGQGMGFWRRDGKEFYFLAADRGFMSVEVNTTQTFEFGKPRLLFRLPEAIGVAPGNTSVSPDGQRFIVSMPPAPMLQQITVFDRQGKILNKVGEPGRFVQPHLSPDGTRVVAMRNDPKNGQQDIWTFEVATGKGYAVTNDVDPQNAPIWSPDGKQVAYVQSNTKGFSSIYKKAWDGSGTAEQVFTYTPGAGMVLTDWSSDNKFMTFFTGVVSLVSLQTGTPADRKAIDWLRDEYEVAQGRWSPDMKYIAYLSLESQVRPEVMVRKFDGTKAEADSKEKAVQVSKEGTMGMIAWRADGKEMFFLQPDLATGEALLMATDVTTTPEFKAGTPKMLFKLKGPLPGNSAQWKGASGDGQKFVFSINVASN
jgi:Tol biopolymer transport system component